VTPPRESVGVESFEKLRMIGKGGFSQVYLVRKRGTDEIYAMKVIKKRTAVRENKGVEYCETERKVLETVSHPFIVGLRYSFQTRQKVYMVLDYARGGELFYHLRRRTPQRFEEPVVRFYAAQITLAFGSLHRMGIIYRDLKPENVCFDEDGHVLLTDFGLAKEQMSSDRRAHSFCGTAEYMAPEMIMQQGHDAGVDWWSLGCLVHELLLGKPPFASAQRRPEEILQRIMVQDLRLPPSVSPVAADFIRQLLSRDASRRLGASRDADEVKEHPFFAGVDWVALYNKETVPPITPAIADALDTSNFDPGVVAAEIEGDEEAGDEWFNSNLMLFKGFDYDPKQVSPVRRRREELRVSLFSLSLSLFFFFFFFF
jgi:serine/threonine protein kinase